MNNKISEKFALSLLEYNTDNLIDIGEICIDNLFDDSVIKEIPCLKTIYGIAKTGFAIREKYMLSKTIHFIDYINKQGRDNDNFEKFKEELKMKSKKRLKELERVLIIIDRYNDEKKINILSNLFINYIDQKIIWEDFCELSDIVDNIFMKDLIELKNVYEKKHITMNQIIDNVSFQRLKNQCLIDDVQSKKRNSNGGIDRFYSEYDYQITELGEKLYEYGIETGVQMTYE